MPDGTVIYKGLPYARCNRCEGIILLDREGLARRHTVPCGLPCQLSPYGEGESACNGFCTRCRTLRTGCAGDPDKPCGRPGCGECGVHGTLDFGEIACGFARPLRRVAWVWSRVTCAGCLRRRPAQGPPAAVPQAP